MRHNLWLHWTAKVGRLLLCRNYHLTLHWRMPGPFAAYEPRRYVKMERIGVIFNGRTQIYETMLYLR